MALDNAALLRVLEAMQAAGVQDRVRTAAQTIYQALIDAELDRRGRAETRDPDPQLGAGGGTSSLPPRQSRLASTRRRPSSLPRRSGATSRSSP